MLCLQKWTWSVGVFSTLQVGEIGDSVMGWVNMGTSLTWNNTIVLGLLTVFALLVRVSSGGLCCGWLRFGAFNLWLFVRKVVSSGAIRTRRLVWCDMRFFSIPSSIMVNVGCSFLKNWFACLVVWRFDFFRVFFRFRPIFLYCLLTCLLVFRSSTAGWSQSTSSTGAFTWGNKLVELSAE